MIGFVAALMLSNFLLRELVPRFRDTSTLENLVLALLSGLGAAIGIALTIAILRARENKNRPQ